MRLEGIRNIIICPTGNVSAAVLEDGDGQMVDIVDTGVDVIINARTVDLVDLIKAYKERVK